MLTEKAKKWSIKFFPNTNLEPAFVYPKYSVTLSPSQTNAEQPQSVLKTISANISCKSKPHNTGRHVTYMYKYNKIRVNKFCFNNFVDLLHNYTISGVFHSQSNKHYTYIAKLKNFILTAFWRILATFHCIHLINNMVSCFFK